MLAVLPLENGREQPYQGRPADWRSHVEPRTISGDSHVEIAAKRRIPQVHWRQPLFGWAFVGRLARSDGQPLEVAGGLPLLRHGLPQKFSGLVWHDWCTF